MIYGLKDETVPQRQPEEGAEMRECERACKVEDRQNWTPGTPYREILVLLSSASG